MTRHDTLISRGDSLFSDKSSLNSLHQEIADHFYVERADFTRTRWLGTDFAAHLVSSYPLIVRRELGNAISSILRPSELEWFSVTVEDEDNLDKAGKEWLEHATKIQRRAMYDRMAGFFLATKEGDHDFATFGQCVLSVEFDVRNQSLLYRSWHLRDCVWTEDYNRQIGELHINWRPKVYELVNWFGEKNLHRTVQEAARKEPNKRIKCRRIVIRADDFQVIGKPWLHDWVIIYIDLENKHVIQEMSIRTRGHIVPRWLTVAGSQYAFSPATVTGLPDARLIQAMTLTLLEAGEMAVRPPMLAEADQIREDFQNFAGGVTYVDSEYANRKHDVLRPLTQNTSALPFGIEFKAEVYELLNTAFYLNKLTLPVMEGDQTAYEISERIKEYIRAARPLFEPMEHEYNHELCDATFEELMPRGAFGSEQEIPESLLGRETRYKFESPLHAAVERQEGVTFLEAKQMVREAYDIDPSTAAHIDTGSALRDALKSIQTPERWLRSEEDVAEITERMAQSQGVRQEAATVREAAEAAATLREAL